MSRNEAYDDVLRAEFGRVKGVSADKALEHADRLDEAAEDATTRAAGERMRERAAGLRDYSADIAEDRKADADAVAETKKPAAAAIKRTRSSGKGRGARTGGAVRRAITAPDTIAAGAIDSASSIVWRLVTLTLVVVLAAVVLRQSGRAAQLLRGAGDLVAGVVRPDSVFARTPPAARAPAAPGPQTPRRPSAGRRPSVAPRNRFDVAAELAGRT